MNISTAIRFRDTAGAAQGLELLPVGFAFDESQSLLTLTMQLLNSSFRKCRLEYLRLTVTIGGQFIGTIVAGHGPRVTGPSGPEYAQAASAVEITASLPLSGVHLSNFLAGVGSGARPTANGTLTITVPSLRAEFDRQVGVRF